MLFIDAKKEKYFQKHGYVSFALIGKDEIDQLINVFSRFESIHHQSTEKFKGTGWIDETDTKEQINESLKPVVTGSLNKYFKNYESLVFGFLMKEQGADSAVPPHQDWTYVDESRFYSMNVWIALEDTFIDNGCLFIIPFSHRLGNYLRSSPSYPVPFKNIIDFIFKFKKPVPLKAGDCVCFNNKTIHGSYPNLGSTNRLAVVTTLYPKDANLLHYYIHDTEKPEEVTEYEIEKKDFLHLMRGLPPANYLKKRSIQTQYKPITKSGFILNWLKSLLS